MERLIKIQSELKAPKSQKNSFGNYYYRSCEDILEAVKPLLQEHKCTLTISDDIIGVGDRIYVKAVAHITDGKEAHTVTAFAREAQDKKGMDASQITGAASSYARKYALNGLFLIDDTKDADTNESQGGPGRANQNTAQTKQQFTREQKQDQRNFLYYLSLCKTEEDVSAFDSEWLPLLEKLPESIRDFCNDAYSNRKQVIAGGVVEPAPARFGFIDTKEAVDYIIAAQKELEALETYGGASS